MPPVPAPEDDCEEEVGPIPTPGYGPPMPPVPAPEDDCEEDYPVGTPVPAGIEEDCEEDYSVGPVEEENCEEDALPTMMPNSDIDLNLDKDGLDKDDDKYNIVDTSAAVSLSVTLSVMTGLILLFC
jgi:hypothetical protein